MTNNMAGIWGSLPNHNIQRIAKSAVIFLCHSLSLIITQKFVTFSNS
jgi:hypothetical protein